MGGSASVGASTGGGPMEISLTDGWGVGVAALLLIGEPCREHFAGEGGSGDGVHSR